MKLLTTKFLLWISLLILFSGCVSTKKSVISYTRYQNERERINRTATSNKEEFAVSIQCRDMEISGICVMKDTLDTVVAVIFNEFGIKAFDFTIDKTNYTVRLSNVASFLDNKFIRKIIEGDLSHLFRSARNKGQKKDKKRHFERTSDNTLILINSKYKIRYRFKKI